MLIHAHGRAVHQLHNFAHSAPGDNAFLAPGFQGLGRHSFGKGDLTVHLGVGTFELVIEIHGDIVKFAVLGLDTDGGGDLDAFLWIFHAVVFDFAV